MSDHTVMTLLLNSMDSKLAKMFIFTESAKELWDKLKVRFGQTNNWAYIFNLKQRISQTKKEGQSNTEYCVEISVLFSELEEHQPLTTDLEEFKQRQERDKVFTYLAGLDPSFEQIRSQILLGPALPDLEAVMAIFQREEARRVAMGSDPGNSNQNHNQEPLAFAATNDKRGRIRSREKCTYCGRLGHNSERCWLQFPHLKPRSQSKGNTLTTGHQRPRGPDGIGGREREKTWGGGGGKAKVFLTKGEGTDTGKLGLETNEGSLAFQSFLNRETGPGFESDKRCLDLGPNQIERSHQLMGLDAIAELQAQVKHLTSLMGQKLGKTGLHPSLNSIFDHAYNYNIKLCLSLIKLHDDSLIHYPSVNLSNKNNLNLSWILDSGATDHLTGNKYLLNVFCEINSDQFFTVANNEKIKILGKGSIKIFHDIIIHDVYLVEKCHVNLLSISKLTFSLKVKVIFDHKEIIFQEPATKKMIGEGIVEDGLYLVKPKQFVFNTSRNKEFYLSHKRIGHPSDQILEKLFKFPHVDHSSCETCKFAKQSRIPFCNSFSKSNEVLELIHSDVWGLAPNSSYNGFKYFVTFIDDFSKNTWLYLMKNKNEVLSNFQNFANFVEN